jgi:competence protein ComEA
VQPTELRLLDKSNPGVFTMRNNVLSYLLLPLFASLSFSLSAAPASATSVPAPVPVVSQLQAQPAKLDLNTADALTLQKELNGIGKAKAEAIVAYRDANGPFASVDELLEIKGIGNALLERNRDKVMVE